MKNKKPRAYVIAVDMGYGHLRAAHPLKKFAVGGIINANSYPGITDKDRNIWKQSRQFYEKVSRFKAVPLIGEKIWKVYDHFQKIPPFYPEGDYSAPNMQLKTMYQLIRKNDWGRHLIEKLSKKPLPILTTFFATAFMAEEFNYPGEIYCVVCDADVSRSWAPLNPSLSRIKYLAPTERVVKRLKQYGVRSENIILTGFPLPESLVKDAKNNLKRRLKVLDPLGNFHKRYGGVVSDYFGVSKNSLNQPVRIMFAVGGAGAQREIGAQIISSLKNLIKDNKVELTMVAGIHNEVASFFRSAVRKNGLTKILNKKIKIISASSKSEYFTKFNLAFKNADVLWTKPSELSFYSELGIPIIIAPPIGSQEEFNASWLLKMGAGISQYETTVTHEWLNDWIESGWLAEAAMQGYVEGNREALNRIEKLIS